jgi:hypothetical protein
VGVVLDGLAAIAQRYAAPVAPDSR